MDISAKQKTQLKHLARDHKLSLVILYGSKAEGTARSDSDMDIAVISEKEPDPELFRSLFSGLSDIFRGENVDVRFLNGADPLYAMQVVKNGVLLAGDPDVFDEYRMYVNRVYVDDRKKYLPFLDQLLDEQGKRLRSLI